MSSNESIQLEEIKRKFPGLTKAIGGYLFEATIIILDECRHRSGCTLQVLSKVHPENLKIHWQEIDVTHRMKSAWADRDRATEAAAECVALLYLRHWNGECVVERARKRTGIDYWIGKESSSNDSEIFHRCLRMEVSGIFSGTVQEMKRRLQQKIKQAEQSENSGLPVWIVVVEFAHLRLLVETDRLALETL